VVEIASETVLRLVDDASVQHVGDGAVVLLARSGQLYTCNSTTEAWRMALTAEASRSGLNVPLAVVLKLTVPVCGVIVLPIWM